MGDDLKQKLALSKARSERLKKARAQAETLLELKSRELFDVNQALQAAQLQLKDDVKQATYELSVSNRRLQAALSERSTFIGQMSHEVRTPLNAIIGLSEILLTTNLDDVQSDYIDTINSGARSLIVLLNDMLDITKIEAGRVDINPQTTETSRLHRNAVAMFEQEAISKNLKLELRLDDKVPSHIAIDKGRYKQIINNLISNALKNTKKGGVLVDVSYEAHVISQNMGMLKVKVVDTGVGIAEDQIARIFNAYEQIGRPNEGVGLGLAICQQLSELMMGKISCDSKLGRGSIFELNLPVLAIHEYKAKNTIPKTSSSRTPLPRLKILVADDNPTNQKVITAQLAQLGQKAEVTNNGAEAMEKLSEQDYDVVILDILMPVMDGEQTIKAIRAAKQTTAQHYCIALTASSYENQKERLLKLGFDAFLSKPLSMDQLADALNDVPRNLWIEPTFGAGSSKDQQQVDQAQQNGFDFTYLETQFGDAHKGIFKEIAPTFLKHAYQELAELKSLSASGDAEKIRRTSHSMKGAASSIGLSHLTNELLQIESKPDSADILNRIEEVEKIMSNLKPLIEHELSNLA